MKDPRTPFPRNLKGKFIQVSGEPMNAFLANRISVGLRGGILFLALFLIFSSPLYVSAQEEVFDRGDRLDVWDGPAHSVSLDQTTYDTSESSVFFADNGTFSRSGPVPDFSEAVFVIQAPGEGQVKLVGFIRDADGAYYNLETRTIRRSPRWQQVRFSLDQVSTAPWTYDPNHRVDMPANSLGFHLTLNNEQGLYLDRIVLEPPRPDPAREEQMRGIMREWEDRLRSQPPARLRVLPALEFPPRLIQRPDELLMETPTYSVSLDPETGKILSLNFGPAGGLPIRPNWDPLWEVVTMDGEIIPAAAAKSFTWQDRLAALNFNYELKGGIRGTLRYLFHPDRIESQILLENPTHMILRWLHYPGGMEIPPNQFESVIWPRLGGVELLPGFFQQRRVSPADYPADLFSDWIAFRMGDRVLSLGTHQNGPFFQSTRSGLLGVGDGAARFRRAIPLYVPQNTGTAIASYYIWFTNTVEQSLEAYSTINEWHTAPKIADRMNRDTYTKLAKSPLIKWDFTAMAREFGSGKETFTEAPQWLYSVPNPSLIHPVAYWEPVGSGPDPDTIFDRNHPNFLPAATQFGGDNAFQFFLQQVRRGGYLVCPYVNPTAWGHDSVGSEEYGDSIAIIDEKGRPHWGWRMYSVNPFNELVRKRNEEYLRKFASSHRVDFVLEDQVGARPNYLNMRLDNLHPTAYTEGWIQHAREMSQIIPLMTERGFDALIPHMTGFCGIEMGLACTQYMKGWEWDNSYGQGNWRVYPVEVKLAREYAVLYHHDLGASVLSDKDLSWCMAKGYSLQNNALENESWILINGAFQTHVLSRFFGQPLLSFEYDEEGNTLSRFGLYRIYANHRDDQDTEVDDQFALPPHGFMVTDLVGRFRAGNFTMYNGILLEENHYLIEDRENNRIVFRDIVPNGSTYVLERHRDWPERAQIRATIATLEGRYPYEFEEHDGILEFTYPEIWQNSPVTSIEFVPRSSR